MPVKVKDVISVLEEYIPLKYAESWDNCGLLVGNVEQDVKKILLSISPTDIVINYAINNNFDMIVTHHPYTITKHNKVSSKDTFGRKTIKLIHNNIAVYAAHTNLDMVGSINEYLANLLELKNIEILIPYKESGFGYGRLCKLEPAMTTYDFAKFIKSKLGLIDIFYTGDKNRMISKVALCSGSGMDLVQHAIDLKADIFITGDLKYHDAIDALEDGISVIDATHFATEIVVVNIFEEFLKEQFSNIEIYKDIFSKNPIERI